MKRRMKHSAGGIAGVVFPLVVVVAAVFVGLFWRNIGDRIAAANYQPSNEIRAIAERATMNDGGEFYFYASRPVLDGTQKFNDYCARREEKSAILGCYSGGKIYIYQISDERLDGIEEVTAAHEMLHAAYDRLTKAEKNRLEPLLKTEYEKVADDELKGRMAYYDRTEPGEHYNELHSIIATEVDSLAPELEEYYKKYFDDRSSIARLHATYQAEFESLENQTTTLANDLNMLADEINTATERYNSDSAQLNADIQTFNARAEDGGYGSQAAFDADRRQLVARSDAIAVDRQKIENNIAAYESKLAQYKALSSEAQDLNNSINSNLAPAPAV